jgi:hypothetical protein
MENTGLPLWPDPNRLSPVIFTALFKVFEHRIFLNKGFDHPYAGIRLLRIGCQRTQRRLQGFAFFMNDGIDKINGERQDRQGSQHIKRQFRFSPEHKEYAHRDKGNEVDKVHDGGPGEHPHTAYILGHAAHQVAGAVCFIKPRIQFLIVVEDLVLLVVFYMAAHDDNGLPHEEHEEAPQ